MKFMHQVTDYSLTNYLLNKKDNVYKVFEHRTKEIFFLDTDVPLKENPSHNSWKEDLKLRTT